MAIKLNAIGVSNIDKDKANPNIRHKYVPDTDFHVNGKVVGNRELEEDDQVYVICDHIVAADNDKYGRFKMDGSYHMGFVEIFKDKVREIHNLNHPNEDREITPNELLSTFGSSDARALIVDVAKHLINSSELSEDEVKN